MLAALAALGVLAGARGALAEIDAPATSFALDCRSLPGGGASVLIEGPVSATTSVRSLDDGSWVVEIADPDIEGLQATSRACRSVAAVTVVPGRAMGQAASRVIIRRGGGAPRLVQQPGHIRMLWLPALGPGATPGIAPLAGATQPSPRVAQSPASGGDDEIARLRAENEELRRRLAEAPGVAAATPEEPAPRPRGRRHRDKAADAGAATVPPESAAGDGSVPSLPSMGTSQPGLGAAPAVLAPVGDAATEAAPAAPEPEPLTPEPVVQPVAERELEVAVATDLREGPGRRYPSAGRMAAGQRVTVDAASGDWSRVRGRGWAFGAYLRAPAGGTPFTGTVSAERSSVRSGPGAQHEAVAEVFRGQQVVIDEVASGWAHVRNGGWVPMQDLTR